MTDKKIELYNELLTEIGLTLETCDSTITPIICEYRSTPENFENLRRDIAQLVMTGEYSIYEAILSIEREYGQLLIED